MIEGPNERDNADCVFFSFFYHLCSSAVLVGTRIPGACPWVIELQAGVGGAAQKGVGSILAGRPS
jgi:hypothetical protein